MPPENDNEDVASRLNALRRERHARHPCGERGGDGETASEFEKISA